MGVAIGLLSIYMLFAACFLDFSGIYRLNDAFPAGRSVSGQPDMHGTLHPVCICLAALFVAPAGT
jgi:hypothetical protein